MTSISLTGNRPLNRYEIKKDGNVLILTETRAGKARAAALRASAVLPWIFGALGLLFGIDYVGGDRSIPGIYYLSTVIALSAAVSVAVGMGRGFRIDLWAIDPDEKVVAFESSLPWGQFRSSAIDFADIQSVLWNKNEGKIVLLIGDYEELIGDYEELICNSSMEEAEEFALALEKIFTDTDVDFVQHDGASGVEPR